MNKAAQALGRLAKGVPKNFSPEELERRRKRIAAINDRKRKASKAKKRRMPNEKLSDGRGGHSLQRLVGASGKTL